MPKEARARSPGHAASSGPYNASSTPLPKSVEQQYRKKCIELKKRIRELEAYNDKLVSDIERKKKTVERVRMERALLTEILENNIPARTTESEGTPSPPPTPQAKERPVRTKKQKVSNTEGTPSQVGGTSPIRGTSPGSPIAAPMSNYTSTFNSKDGNPVEKGKGRASTGGVAKKSSKDKKKKPMNAYLLFCAEEEHRARARLPVDDPQYRARNSSSPIGPDEDTSTIKLGPGNTLNHYLAKTWRDLGPAGQKKYTDMHQELLAQQAEFEKSVAPKNETNSEDDQAMQEDEE